MLLQRLTASGTESVPGRLLGVVITLVGVLALTPDALLVRMVAADVWTVSFYRGLFIAIAFATFQMMRHGVFGVARLVRGLGWAGLGIAACQAADIVVFVAAVKHTSAANALLILAASPLIAALLARLFLREHLTSGTLLAAGAVIVGLFTIVAGELGGGSLLGEGMAALCSAALATKLVLMRAAREDEVVPALMIGALAGATFAALLAPQLAVTGRDLGLLAVMGLVEQPVAFGLITVGLRYLAAPEVSLLMLLETALGPVWVLLVLGEVPGRSGLAGGSLILLTLILYFAAQMRRIGAPAAQEECS